MEHHHCYWLNHLFLCHLYHSKRSKYQRVPSQTPDYALTIQFRAQEQDVQMISSAGFRSTQKRFTWPKCVAHQAMNLGDVYANRTSIAFNHTHTHIYIYICMYINSFISHRHTHTYTYMHACMHTDRRTDRQTDRHPCMHVHTQIYIYIYICIPLESCLYTWVLPQNREKTAGSLGDVHR